MFRDQERRVQLLVKSISQTSSCLTFSGWQAYAQLPKKYQANRTHLVSAQTTRLVFLAQGLRLVLGSPGILGTMPVLALLVSGLQTKKLVQVQGQVPACHRTKTQQALVQGLGQAHHQTRIWLVQAQGLGQVHHQTRIWLAQAQGLGQVHHQTRMWRALVQEQAHH